jgi:hypothetical protein
MILSVALALPPGPPARASDAPATVPSRDVDVVYRLGPPGGADPRRERVRWDVAHGLQRIDPPTPGLHMILDYRTKRLVSLRDRERLALVIDGAAIPAAVGGYVRHGDATVAGLPCTDWETRPAQGEPSLICFAPDGVTLRLSQRGVVLIEAISVSYAPADPTVFAVPSDFRAIALKGSSTETTP